MITKDIIKNSVYNGLGGGTSLSIYSILMILVMACFIGIYIYAVYRFTSKAAFYSRDLNITIAGMPVIVAAIMIAMQSNLIVSLGMVGALSIVRFRNAVKNPLDLLYLFWTISAGIICGVGLWILALGLCIIMTVLLLVLGAVPASKALSILVLGADNDNVDWIEVRGLIKKYTKYHKQKSRSIKGNETEIIYEIRTGQEEELVKALQKYTQIGRINFLSHDGEYRI